MQYVEPEGGHCEVPRWHLLKQELTNHSPEDFLSLFEKTPDAVLLDVRTQQEHREFTLPGSVLLDYLSEDFIDALEALDPRIPYFVYCRSGRRSVRTCTLMKNAGFSRLHHLEGGLVAWESSARS